MRAREEGEIKEALIFHPLLRYLRRKEGGGEDTEMGERENGRGSGRGSRNGNGSRNGSRRRGSEI